MRIGPVLVDQRTIKRLYYAAGSFTVLVVGVGLFLLLGVLLIPEARELPLR
jgi:hypothetical protein